MRRILLALSALALLCAPVQAQNPDALTSCGPTAYFTNGKPGRLSVDLQGRLCINGTITGTFTLPTTPTIAGGSGVVLAPSTETGAGITPVISAALESNHVIKASAGNFYSGYITTGATAGWLLLANSTTAPTAGGAAIAPIACVIAPANATTSISGPGGIPIIASIGITLVFSTSGCLTNTASTTAFFSGMAK